MARKRQAPWEDEQRVRNAWKDAKSMSEIIKTLGLTLCSASYLNCKRWATVYGLEIPDATRDTSAARMAITRPLEEILVVDSYYGNRQHLKKRMIRAGLKKDVCEKCGGGPEWHGKKLVLQLDHINGVGSDNRLENLAILCPNCHSQTPTFGYKAGINR